MANLMIWQRKNQVLSLGIREYEETDSMSSVQCL